MFDVIFPIVYILIVLLSVLVWGYWKINTEGKQGDN